MTADRTAVLVMAYGTPRSRDEIEPYYTDIRRGRPPTPDQLADLSARYEAIGGLSPLAQRTEAQRFGLQRALDEREPGRYEVVLGLKHADPKIEATVAELADRGFRQIIGLVLAPHYSAYSIGQYLDRARVAAAAFDVDIRVAGVESWAVEPTFVEFLAAEVVAGLARLPVGTRVLFTAHSLPSRIVAAGDPYPDQLRSTAEAVAAAVGLTAEQWGIAWQSAGRTPEPWLGPDILEVISASADTEVGLLVCACGFVSDHLEVLYDLDIEAAHRADQVGLAFGRTGCVNDDPTVLGALADRVANLAGPGGVSGA